MDREWKTLEEYHEKYGKGMISTTVFETFEELGSTSSLNLIEVREGLPIVLSVNNP